MWYGVVCTNMHTYALLAHVNFVHEHVVFSLGLMGSHNWHNSSAICILKSIPSITNHAAVHLQLSSTQTHTSDPVKMFSAIWPWDTTVNKWLHLSKQSPASPSCLCNWLGQTRKPLCKTKAACPRYKSCLLVECFLHSYSHLEEDQHAADGQRRLATADVTK